MPWVESRQYSCTERYEAAMEAAVIRVVLSNPKYEALTAELLLSCDGSPSSSSRVGGVPDEPLLLEEAASVMALIKSEMDNLEDLFFRVWDAQETEKARQRKRRRTNQQFNKPISEGVANARLADPSLLDDHQHWDDKSSASGGDHDDVATDDEAKLDDVEGDSAEEEETVTFPNISMRFDEQGRLMVMGMGDPFTHGWNILPPE